LESEIPVGTFLHDVFIFKDNFHGNDDATIWINKAVKSSHSFTRRKITNKKSVIKMKWKIK
jgi:hypothetical protein